MSPLAAGVRPAALIFDSDGVLVDSEAIHIVAERELLATHGIDIAYDDYLTRFVGMRDIDWLAAVAAEFAARGVPFPEAAFDEELSAAVDARIATDLVAIDGIAEVVASFAGPVAVASSADPQRLRRKLTIAGLIDLFEPHIYSGAEVENGKPAPDLFLHAAARLDVAPDTCLVVEDSTNGVRAGCAAGMRVVGFTGGAHADDDLARRLLEAGADAVVASHAELSDRISAMHRVNG